MLLIGLTWGLHQVITCVNIPPVCGCTPPPLTAPPPLLPSYLSADRYVLVGNHRDAWIMGATDPSSGTASMLELSRVLANLKKETGESAGRG